MRPSDQLRSRNSPPAHFDTNFKVLFIAGASRSGSTLLEKVLGGLKGIIALGEVSFIWERGFGSNLLCGCGKPFSECETWRKIRLNAFNKENELDIDWIVKTSQYIQRARRLPQLLWRSIFPVFSKLVKYHANHYYRLYRGAAQFHNSKILIDSSKHVHGHVLSTSPDINLYVLHLVRNGNATVHSWTRKKIYQEEDGKIVYFDRYHPWFGALVWLFDNLSAELMRIHCKNYLRVRYEDFCQNPSKTLNEILHFIDEPTLTVQLQNSFHSNLQHSISGNPVRYKHGRISINCDKEWESAMSKTTKRLVFCIAWPLLLRYGYLSEN